MSKFKVGDRVRILSDALLSGENRTVVDYHKVDSSVGLIANIDHIIEKSKNRVLCLICNLPINCYAPYTKIWSYTEDQLELVDDTAKQDFLAQHIRAHNDAFLESDNRPYSEDVFSTQLGMSVRSKDKQPELQDMVNHPAHYTAYPLETKDWNFAVMQTIKDPIYCAYFKTMSEYLHRAHLKNGLEDIKKLLFWGNELVKHVEDGKVEVK